MSLGEMWCSFCSAKQDFIPSYVTYHYFRSKGWVPKIGIKYGTDWGKMFFYKFTSSSLSSSQFLTCQCCLRHLQKLSNHNTNLKYLQSNILLFLKFSLQKLFVFSTLQGGYAFLSLKVRGKIVFRIYIQTVLLRVSLNFIQINWIRTDPRAANTVKNCLCTGVCSVIQSLHKWLSHHVWKQMEDFHVDSLHGLSCVE